MITLKQIFKVFGHDPKWARFAIASIAPMTAVFFRKMGDRDITTITDFDIQQQLAMSEQPEDRKVKARACIDHLRQWAAEQGKPFALPAGEQKLKAEPEPKAEPPSNDPPKGEDWVYLKAFWDCITKDKRHMQMYLDGDEMRYRNHQRDKRGKLKSMECYFVERRTLLTEKV